MRKKYEIWCEGDPRFNYTACNLGFAWGNSFREACKELASRNAHFAKFYNGYHYRDCKLFDNYESAKISYG